jgi:hypothetical protein
MVDKAAHLDIEMIMFMFMQAKEILRPPKFIRFRNYRSRMAAGRIGAPGQQGHLITELLTREAVVRIK